MLALELQVVTSIWNKSPRASWGQAKAEEAKTYWHQYNGPWKELGRLSKPVGLEFEVVFLMPVASGEQKSKQNPSPVDQEALEVTEKEGFLGRTQHPICTKAAVLITDLIFLWVETCDLLVAYVCTGSGLDRVWVLRGKTLLWLCMRKIENDIFCNKLKLDQRTWICVSSNQKRILWPKLKSVS